MKNLFSRVIFVVMLKATFVCLSQDIEIPIVVHIVQKSDGTSPRLSSEEVEEAIGKLNDGYNNLGIRFTKCAENRINDDEIWRQFDSGEDANQLLLESHCVKNVANVFFTDLISGSHGRAVFPYKQRDWVIADYKYVLGEETTLIHEFGHYFGLRHTYSGVDDDPASSSSLTIRDAEGEEGWKYGDYLIDTPLDPEKRSDYDSQCNYIGNQVDANGDAFHPDGTNYMGKGHGECRSSFSEGQKKRMIEYIKRYRYYLKCNTTSSNNNRTCTNTTPVTNYPQNDDFDRDDTLNDVYWVQARDGDDLNWSNGPSTSSSGTGPSGAQNGQTFMYLEASEKFTSHDKAILLSPCFDLTGKDEATIEFYYHMYGVNTGTLGLDVSEDGGVSWNSLFSLSGEQQSSEASPWIKETITLNEYVGKTIQLRFVAIAKGSSKSDIAIDNVTVNATESSLSVQENKLKTLQYYPNPVIDELRVEGTSHIEELSIYTILGMAIHSEENKNDKSTINVSHLSKGIYLAKVITERGEAFTFKFVKN